MFPKGESPFRVKDLIEKLKLQDQEAYIVLGGSINVRDGLGGKYINMMGINSEEISLWFEDKEKLTFD